MVVLTVKLVALTLSVTWGLTKTILFGVGLPVILAVLFIAGLTAFAVPMLILALLGVFLLSGCAGQENAAAPYAGYGYDADGNGTSSETTTMGSLQKNNGTKSDSSEKKTTPKSNWENEWSKYEKNQNDGYNGSFGHDGGEESSHVYNEYDGMNFGFAS